MERLKSGLPSVTATSQQHRLHTLLGSDWVEEYPLYHEAANYPLLCDLAFPALKVAVELGTKVTRTDELLRRLKKELYLKELGWQVFFIYNDEIDTDIYAVALTLLRTILEQVKEKFT